MSMAYTLSSHLAVSYATWSTPGKVKTSLLMEAACNAPLRMPGGS